MGFITTESGESVVLEDSSQDNPTGTATLFSLKLVHKTQMVFLKLELMEKTNIFNSIMWFLNNEIIV